MESKDAVVNLVKPIGPWAFMLLKSGAVIA